MAAEARAAALSVSAAQLAGRMDAVLSGSLQDAQRAEQGQRELAAAVRQVRDVLGRDPRSATSSLLDRVGQAHQRWQEMMDEQARLVDQCSANFDTYHADLCAMAASARQRVDTARAAVALASAPLHKQTVAHVMKSPAKPSAPATTPGVPCDAGATRRAANPAPALVGSSKPRVVGDAVIPVLRALPTPAAEEPAPHHHHSRSASETSTATVESRQFAASSLASSASMQSMDTVVGGGHAEHQLPQRHRASVSRLDSLGSMSSLGLASTSTEATRTTHAATIERSNSSNSASGSGGDPFASAASLDTVVMPRPVAGSGSASSLATSVTVAAAAAAVGLGDSAGSSTARWDSAASLDTVVMARDQPSVTTSSSQSTEPSAGVFGASEKHAAQTRSSSQSSLATASTAASAEQFTFLEPGPLAEKEIVLCLVGRRPLPVPTYSFDVVLVASQQVIGQVDLRIGSSPLLRLIEGHISVSIATQHRGNGYAGHVCRALAPLARSHGMVDLSLTVSRTNAAALRLCQALGAQVVGEADVPVNCDAYRRGDRVVIQHVWALPASADASLGSLPTAPMAAHSSASTLGNSAAAAAATIRHDTMDSRVSMRTSVPARGRRRSIVSISTASESTVCTRSTKPDLREALLTIDGDLLSIGSVVSSRSSSTSCSDGGDTDGDSHTGNSSAGASSATTTSHSMASGRSRRSRASTTSSDTRYSRSTMTSFSSRVTNHNASMIVHDSPGGSAGGITAAGLSFTGSFIINSPSQRSVADASVSSTKAAADASRRSSGSAVRRPASVTEVPLFLQRVRQQAAEAAKAAQVQAQAVERKRSADFSLFDEHELREFLLALDHSERVELREAMRSHQQALDDIAAEISRRERARAAVVAEILSTERTYVDALQMLVQVYLMPLARRDGRPMLTTDQHSVVFRGVETILAFNAQFLQQLADLWHEDEGVGDAVGIGPVFLTMSPFLKMYSAYINNYNMALMTLQQTRKRNVKLSAFLDKCHETCGYGIADLLIQPVQRIPRYLLLLRELVKHTDDDHPDHASLRSALEKVAAVADSVNASKEDAESLQRVVELQSLIDDRCPNLVEPHRRLVAEGPVGWIAGPGARSVHDRYMILFNDILIITSERQNRFFGRNKAPLQFRTLLPLTRDMQVFDEAASVHRRVDGTDNALCIMSEGTVWTVCLQSEADREAWLQRLQHTLTMLTPA